MRQSMKWLAAFVAIVMLIPTAAMGEVQEGPARGEAAIIAESPAEAGEAQSQGVEAVSGETTLMLGENGVVENAGADPQFYEKTVDPAAKSPTIVVSVGDTLRLRVSGASGAAWKSGKSGYVTLTGGADESGPYTDIRADREIKKLKLTASLTGASKKKATVTLAIQNPWQPRNLNVSGLPDYIPVGATLDLRDYVVLEPEDALTTLTFKSSGAGKVDKGTSLLRAAKAGKAKITVTTANKLKATCTLEVRANKAQFSYGKPSAGDVASVAGGWTLWPVSVEPAKKGGLLCQFQLLNGTGEKVTKIQNLTLSIAAGSRDNIIAGGRNMTVKASVAKGKAKVVKITLPAAAGLNGVFLPDCQRANQLFFNINQDGAALVSKSGSYGFIYNPRFPAPMAVQSIELSQSAAALRAGEQLTLIATVQPAGAAVRWLSSDESVARVVGGVVTAVGAGNAVITAAAVDGSGVSARCRVSVSGGASIPVTSISLTPGALTLSEGESYWLTAEVFPGDATNPALRWKSSDESVARVDDGLVTAIGAGDAVITAAAADGSGVSARCAVTVSGGGSVVPVSEIELTPATLTLSVGESHQLTAEVFPGNATNPALRWSTNDGYVARVDDSGLVTAVGAGDAVITAAAADGSGVSARCAVTVSGGAASITSVALEPSDLTMEAGETRTLKLIVQPPEAADRLFDLSFSWNGGSEAQPLKILDFSGGVVTFRAIREGWATVYVRATDGSGLYGTCSVTIVPSTAPAVPISHIALSPETLNLSVGEARKLTAQVLPEEVLDPKLTWRSADDSVASVSDGTVKGVGPGTTRIFAEAADGSGVSAACEVTVTELTGWTRLSLGVASRTQAQVRDFVSAHPVDLRNESAFRVAPSTSEPYAYGLLTEAAIQNGLNMVNQCRYVAGLNADVTADSSQESAMAAAALVNALNSALSHYPSRPSELSDSRYDALYELAKKGCGSANLSYGPNNIAQSVLNEMEDSDGNNIDRVGHRRWILNPGMGKTMFGRCGRFSSLYAFDKSGSGTQKRVAWPAGQMPLSMFDGYHAWSVSYGKSLNIDDIRVVLTRERDGRVWVFSSTESDGDFYVDNGGYGLKGCVIFRPDGQFEIEADDTFQVQIFNSEDATCLEYSVHFFEL